MEFRGRLTLDGTQAARDDVAALRAELEAARGSLVKIGQAAHAQGFGQAVKETVKGFDAKDFKAGVVQTEIRKRLEERALQQMGLGLSQAEKAAARKQEEARKQAQRKQEEAAKEAIRRRDESNKDASKRYGESFSAKIPGAGAAAVGVAAAAGTAGAASLARLALGYRATAQLQMLVQRTAFQFRQLFAGVNAQPVVRAADRFLQMFTKGTIEGRALSDLFGRIFNPFFRGIEGAQPAATALVDGLILGGLRVENAWLKTRIALLPLATALEEAVGQADALGLTAGFAEGPFKAISTWASSIASAIDTATAAAKAFNAALGGLPLAVLQKAPQLLNRGYSAAAGFVGGAAKDAAGLPGAVGRLAGQRDDTVIAGALSSDVRPRGTADGAAFVAGMVQGVIDGLPLLEAAGASAAQAVDTGTRRKGEIHSPSQLARRTGRQFPAGEAQGINDGAPAVEAAAARSMVPRVDAEAGKGSSGTVGMTSMPPIIVHNYWPEGVTGAKRAEIEAAAEAGFDRAIRRAAATLGVSRRLT